MSIINNVTYNLEVARGGMKIMSINSKKLDFHRNYFETSYKQDFKEGQGLEEILSVIKTYACGGNWLDLGCGVNPYLWMIPMQEEVNLTCVDIDEEVQIVIDEIKENKFNQGCYKYAFDNFAKFSPNEIYSRPYTFISKDLLNEEIIFNDKYHLITQFGLLGLLDDEFRFLQKSKELLSNLSKGGVYIGANWIYSKKMQKSNDYLTIELIKKVASTNNCSLLYFSEVNIQNDDKFDKVVIYVMKKMPQTVGYHQIFDCYNVDLSSIENEDQIKKIIHTINKSLNHRIINEIYYTFSPHGITGLAIISGSHIAVHTWPEYKYVSVDVFSCYNKKDQRPPLFELEKILNTKDIFIRENERIIF